jgi:hypothetical protein
MLRGDSVQALNVDSVTIRRIAITITYCAHAELRDRQRVGDRTPVNSMTAHDRQSAAATHHGNSPAYPPSPIFL